MTGLLRIEYGKREENITLPGRHLTKTTLAKWIRLTSSVMSSVDSTVSSGMMTCEGHFTCSISSPSTSCILIMGKQKLNSNWRTFYKILN